MNEDADIIIAGAGPTGMALALALRDSAYRVCVVEPRTAPPTDAEDTRNLALTYGSRLILERLGAWETLAATPIEAVLVSEQGSFGRVEFTAAEMGVPALGYVVRHAQLRRSLATALQNCAIPVMYGQAAHAIEADAIEARVHVAAVDGTQRILSAKLLAVADGGASAAWAEVKIRHYPEMALSCDVISQTPHLNRAFERFTSDGPVALLPTAEGWSLVWIATAARAEALVALDAPNFCCELRATFGGALGGFTLRGARQMFPLALRYTTAERTPRTILLGNAAQTLHPVAAQGFNLGLRDAWELARNLIGQCAEDPGTPKVLAAHRKIRRRDRIATIAFTDSLIRLFSNDIPMVRRARGLGLVTLSAFPFVKKLFLRRMLFGARGGF